MARIFNDAAGVVMNVKARHPLTHAHDDALISFARNSRSARDATRVYTYLSLGCSKAAEQRMLNFARAQVGKPFSNMGMARSLLYPRATDHRTYYCAGANTQRGCREYGCSTRALLCAQNSLLQS